MELREKVARHIHGARMPFTVFGEDPAQAGAARELADAVIAICFEEAAKVADAEAIRLRDDQSSILFMHGALLAATAIRDRISQPKPASK